VVEKVEFPQIEVPLPFPSSQDFAAQAAKKMTHALLNPQPAGPFCQVGDEKMLALTRLAAIVEGALPTHKSVATSPHVEIVENDTPPSVHIAVSPPRVINEATPPRVMQPTVTHITTPKFTSKIESNAMQSSNTHHSTFYDKEKYASTKLIQ
jgi:hypothetical protein